MSVPNLKDPAVSDKRFSVSTEAVPLGDPEAESGLRDALARANGEPQFARGREILRRALESMGVENPDDVIAECKPKP